MAVLAAPALQAQLLLDFGPTTPTGTNLSNSPLHSVQPLTGTNWNIVGTSDVSSGLIFANGTPATGVALNLGVSPSSNIINFATNPASSNALGTAVNSGIFSGDSVGKDAVFSGTATQNNRLGIKITGLAVGTYDIYFVGINTNIAFDDARRSMLFGALATTDVASLDTSALTTQTIANFGTGLTSSWSEGLNYGKATVTLSAANPVLTIFSYNTHPDNLRGFFNTIQVVPEPGPVALLGLGALALLLQRLRRPRRVD